MTRLGRFTGSFLARLALGYILVAAVFAAAWLWSLYGPLTRAAVKQQQSNLTAVAQSAALVASESTATPEQIAKRLVARTDLRLTLVSVDGSVLADSDFDAGAMENHAGRPEIRSALEGRVGTDRRVSRTKGVEELYVAVPASLGGERIALRVSQPLDEIERIAARSRRVGLLLLGTALVIALSIALQATRKAAKPVQELSRAAERMARGDLSAEVPAVPADLESLAGALSTLRSQMRARLEALEAEKLTLRATLDGLADAVFVFEGDRVQLANSAAGEMFRTPAGGWQGVALDDASLPAALEGAIRANLGRSGATAIELAPDPVGTTLRLLVAPLESTGNARMIVTVADVTERAQLDRIRRDFVANASHELKTPASGIRLLAQSVEAAADDGDVGQALEFARKIETETERLQRLVGDLLDLSRLEATPAENAAADVRRAVDTALLSHRGAAQRKQLTLEADLSAVRGADPYVAADATDFAIALDNLIDNAIAYTDTGGVAVGVATTDDFVLITVKDTGVGIPAEHLSRIFERFYRVDGGRSRESGGTGLGLALVRHVAERNGGSVAVESEVGRGSTFTLRLPRRR